MDARNEHALRWERDVAAWHDEADVVVVGLSEAKAIWRDIRQIVPIIAVFRPLYN